MGVLVFGAGGQLGQDLARRTWPRGLEMTGLTRAAGDVTDRDAVFAAVRAHAPAVVVNAAAYTAVDKAESEPEAAFAGNEAGPHHLAEACAAAGVPLIHVSTDYVFDGTKAGAYTEADPVAPLGVYGRSKEAGERAVRETWDRHVILRTAWVYGPFGANFVKTMLRLGAERELLRVVDDQHGCPTATGDLAEAIVAIAARLAAGDGETGTFHYCGGGATTWCGFARAVFETAATLGHRVPVVEAITTDQYPTPARRPANSVLDCGKLERAYGIAPRPWRAAVDEVVRELSATR